MNLQNKDIVLLFKPKIMSQKQYLTFVDTHINIIY